MFWLLGWFFAKNDNKPIIRANKSSKWYTWQSQVKRHKMIFYRAFDFATYQSELFLSTKRLLIAPCNSIRLPDPHKYSVFHIVQQCSTVQLRAAPAISKTVRLTKQKLTDNRRAGLRGWQEDISYKTLGWHSKLWQSNIVMLGEVNASN